MRVETELQQANDAHQKILDEQESLHRRLERSNERIQQLLANKQDAIDDRSEAVKRGENNSPNSPNSGECQQPFTEFLKTYYAQLHELGEENKWQLPNSTFKVQEQNFSRLKQHTCAILEAFNDKDTATPWTASQKHRVRAVKTWFESNSRFTLPEHAALVFESVLQGTEQEAEATSAKRAGETGSAGIEDPGGKKQSVFEVPDSPYLLCPNSPPPNCETA